MGRNIYETDRSCYARREGVFVPGEGVNKETAPAIAALILRDFLRGYTYTHECTEIPMDENLYIKRLNYLVALARKHTGSEAVARWVKDLVDYVIIHGRLPPNIVVRLEGRPASLAKVAEDLRGRAVIKPVKAIELPPIPKPVIVRKRRRYAYAYA